MNKVQPKISLSASGKSSMSLILASVLFINPGCGSWTGNPPGVTDNNPASVSLSIVGSAPALTLMNSVLPITGKSGALIGTFDLTAARISIAEIKLKADTDDLEERENFNGPYVVNLLTNEVMPSLSSINLPAGEYKELTFKIQKLDEDEVEGINGQDPLFNQSVYLSGIYTPASGAPINVSMKVDVDEEFSLMKPSSSAPGVQISGGIANQVIIAFRLKEWFNFTGLEYDFNDLSSGDAQLDKNGNEIEKQLMELVKDNIEDSADFGDDENGDGELSENEDTDDSNDDEETDEG